MECFGEQIPLRCVHPQRESPHRARPRYPEVKSAEGTCLGEQCVLMTLAAAAGTLWRRFRLGFGVGFTWMPKPSYSSFLLYLGPWAARDPAGTAPQPRSAVPLAPLLLGVIDVKALTGPGLT